MEPQEADETARLYVRSWQAGYKGLLPQYYLDLLSPERWKDSFAGLPGSFVLTEGGVIAGHSCARPAADEKMPGWGEVYTLYVLPEYWGRGFGTALLDNSVRWLKNQGFDRSSDVCSSDLDIPLGAGRKRPGAQALRKIRLHADHGHAPVPGRKR